MIEQYISELLFKYDSVILPGFGAFVLKYSPSSIHPIENRICPPAKYVSFDPTLKSNDGILANYLSEKERVPFFDACTMILGFVEQTNKSLEEGNEIVLAKLGTMSRSEDGISFTPDTTVNYNPEAFGMEEIVSAPILRDDIKARIQEQFDNKIRPVTQRKRIPRVAVWITVIVVIMGGAIGALFIIQPAFISNINLSALFKKSEMKDTSIVVATTKQNVETDLKADVRSDDTAVPDSSTVQNNSADLNKPATQAVSAGNFHIISASFRVKENADRYVLTLQQQGYNSSQLIFLPEKVMYVVSYNSFATKAEAAQALEKIRSTVNASAWILNH
jgi:hypothetical protein